jgi:hypothetical protein
VTGSCHVQTLEVMSFRSPSATRRLRSPAPEYALVGRVTALRPCLTAGLPLSFAIVNLAKISSDSLQRAFTPIQSGVSRQFHSIKRQSKPACCNYLRKLLKKIYAVLNEKELGLMQLDRGLATGAIGTFMQRAGRLNPQLSALLRSTAARADSVRSRNELTLTA